jgi:hypothetical protein
MNVNTCKGSRFGLDLHGFRAAQCVKGLRRSSKLSLVLKWHKSNRIGAIGWPLARLNMYQISPSTLARHSTVGMYPISGCAGSDSERQRNSDIVFLPVCMHAPAGHCKKVVNKGIPARATGPCRRSPLQRQDIPTLYGFWI